MNIVGLVWIAVALVIWSKYKISRWGDSRFPLAEPPQRTFVGALMWPIYLCIYLVSAVGSFLRSRPE